MSTQSTSSSSSSPYFHTAENGERMSARGGENMDMRPQFEGGTGKWDPPFSLLDIKKRLQFYCFWIICFF